MTDMDELVEDAELMRKLKEQIKGIDVTLAVNERIGTGHTQVLAVLWRRIMLEANQGV